MIRPLDRKVARVLVALGVWRIEEQMWNQRLRPRKGTRWLWNWMRQRQDPEPVPYHHAPACPANRWSGMELVLQGCRCGAVKHGVVARGRLKE